MLIYFTLKVNPKRSSRVYSITNYSKNIKLQPVPPSMLSEALSVRVLDIHSASSGIDGGTGCNFIFFRIYIVSSIMGMYLAQIVLYVTT